MVQGTDPQRSEATRLGSYEILRKLARGGMAELFLARTHGPEGFEKLVVLKKILPNFAANPKFVRLFLDEAKLAATLDHPHIAHVYDMGKVDGNYFFTMEYIHGQDVRATLRRTARVALRVPLDHAVQVVHAVASALHYAHERRKPDGSLLDIVHRDVSPSNILISYDGAIKLVDFGVAKAATSSVKTRTGTLKGKIAYMSPEQAKGGGVDRRSDIFSLGIVLWELITTQRLFRGDNDLATIQLIINSHPTPPREIRPETPEELERIVLKALAIDPDARYQTAEQLQLDLEEFAREHKLKQSTVALRTHMHDLFADEIRAWKEAQASGMTLTDHVVSASVVEMTTPVSDHELSFLEDDGEDVPDDDDDDADDPQQAPTQGMITAVPPHRPSTPAAGVAVPPKVMLGRLDHTPLPPGASALAVRRQGTMPPPIPIHHTPSGAVRMITPPSAGPSPNDSASLAARAPYAREPTGFPIAPREWRDAESLPGGDQREPQRRRLIIGALIGVATLAVIALATGGTAPLAAQVEIKPEAVEPAPAIDMDVERPKAVVVDANEAAAAGSGSGLGSGSGSSVESTGTGSGSATTRPSTRPHHRPTTPTPKTPTPKTNPKYDPNSALPPP